jgi:ribosomal protein L37AE/L43A
MIRASETCQDCGTSYETVYRVPDEVWSQIRPEGKPEGGGLLCLDCANLRARRLGIDLWWTATVGGWA